MNNLKLGDWIVGHITETVKFLHFSIKEVHYLVFECKNKCEENNEMLKELKEEIKQLKIKKIVNQHAKSIWKSWVEGTGETQYWDRVHKAWVDSAPRNPCDESTNHVGGQ